jgi:carbamoyl-phosphate synthase large subunit
LLDNLFKKQKKLDYWRLKRPQFYAVKEAMFSFEKFLKSDIILGPEMKSTGEVMGVDTSFAKAYAKALIATKQTFATKGKVFISVRNEDKTSELVEVAKTLTNIGFRILATKGTGAFLMQNNINFEPVHKVHESPECNIVKLISAGEINFVINTTSGLTSVKDSFTIRRAVLSKRVLHATTLEGASCIVEAIASLSTNIICN